MAYLLSVVKSLKILFLEKAGFPLVEKRATDRKTGNSGAAFCRPVALFVRTWRVTSRVVFYHT